MYLKKTWFISSHSSFNTFSTTSIPASLSIATPLPATFGFGSLEPIKHFFIPISIIFFAQGGVFP